MGLSSRVITTFFFSSSSPSSLLLQFRPMHQDSIESPPPPRAGVSKLHPTDFHEKNSFKFWCRSGSGEQDTSECLFAFNPSAAVTTEASPSQTEAVIPLFTCSFRRRNSPRSSWLHSNSLEQQWREALEAAGFVIVHISSPPNPVGGEWFTL
ncbi:unnamed protein product [Pleuronectes platessa]|uniref:Uncharacterized protein n=1 Tax=Pleuronectes platessa TaxID=8262 RepID=A0A9N7V5S3_PLEPL|nr:unnamed protein product [Pleuronectes platessa]